MSPDADAQELPGFLNQEGAGSGGVSPALALPTGIAGVTGGLVTNSVTGNTSEDGNEVVFTAPADHDEAFGFDIDHAEADSVVIENFDTGSGDLLVMGELLTGEGYQEGESLTDYLKADENDAGDTVLHLGHADSDGNFVESKQITLSGVSMGDSTGDEFVEALGAAGHIAGLGGPDTGSLLSPSGGMDLL